MPLLPPSLPGLSLGNAFPGASVGGAWPSPPRAPASTRRLQPRARVPSPPLRPLSMAPVSAGTSPASSQDPAGTSGARFPGLSRRCPRGTCLRLTRAEEDADTVPRGRGRPLAAVPTLPAYEEARPRLRDALGWAGSGAWGQSGPSTPTGLRPPLPRPPLTCRARSRGLLLSSRPAKSQPSLKMSDWMERVSRVRLSPRKLAFSSLCSRPSTCLSAPHAAEGAKESSGRPGVQGLPCPSLSLPPPDHCTVSLSHPDLGSPPISFPH